MTHPVTPAELAALAASDRPFLPAECADLARRASAFVDTGALDRTGPGSYLLLWRDENSEAWLNTWWESRDTGYHDHQGSCVGVYVLEGTATQEGLPIGRPRQPRRYRAGESFSFPGSGIHRMDHDAGAVTIHVYSPPLRTIGHYEIIDGELHRTPGAADEGSPVSPRLLRALDSDVYSAAPRSS
ncbi:MAG TPA: hypothetical protein VK735_00850 [Pseudonocardia sp.]|uniref:hypothetical protein n=1 Tax=Pseudonocardia sp. TaxID=60912 RepID=UPI002D175866|nr:hypothetical protein [Pseudonocardia sp.]HTF45975.1 hypothetical protein [Pseudonocardia sp.]